MLRSLLFTFLAFCAFQTTAQTAYYTNLLSQWNTQNGLSGGNWSIPADEQLVLNAFTGYGGTAGTVNISGQPFTKARSFTVATAGVNPWDAAVYITNTVSIAQGDKILVTMWIKSATAATGRGSLYIEHIDTYDKEAYFTFDIATQWTQLTLPFEANTNYPVGKLRFGFQVGQKAQTLQIGGIAVRNFANTYPLSQLPIDLHQDYAGSEPAAPWRAEAAARIEQIRKADLQVTVKDGDGNPTPGAVVQVEMLQHQFKFGSAITASRIAGNNGQNNTYQQKILDFDGQGHGFNEIVFENDLKWDAWEAQWSVSHAELVQAVQWLRNRDISIRGHNLVWPAWQYLPDNMEANQTNLPFLKNRINDRIQTMLSWPGLVGNVAEWDVLNEITFNQDLANAFKGSPGYPTGREIYVDILNKVKAVDPTMVAYLNDYVTLDRGSTVGSPDFEQCKQYIQEAKSAGAPIEGIGFQAHIGAGLVSMYDTKQTLDAFYDAFGCRAKITEFDYSDLVSDTLAARFTGDLLTLCFSHPSVDGFLSWGFWNGAHWLGNAPYYREDWTLRPAGQRVAHLLFHDWWTNTTLTTNPNGVAQVRGFKGKYRIQVLCNGQVIATDTVQLIDNQQLNYVCNTSAVTAPATSNLQVVFASPVRAGATFFVQCSEIPALIRLHAANGQLVETVHSPTASTAFTIQAAGIYWLEITDQRGLIQVKKVVVN